MAKKARSHSTANKKQATAKQAYKKKHMSAAKFRNDQLRENLDRQAYAIYATPQPPMSLSIENARAAGKDSVNDLLKSLSSTNL